MAKNEISHAGKILEQHFAPDWVVCTTADISNGDCVSALVIKNMATGKVDWWRKQSFDTKNIHIPHLVLDMVQAGVARVRALGGKAIIYVGNTVAFEEIDLRRRGKSCIPSMKFRIDAIVSMLTNEIALFPGFPLDFSSFTDIQSSNFKPSSPLDSNTEGIWDLTKM